MELFKIVSRHWKSMSIRTCSILFFICFGITVFCAACGSGGCLDNGSTLPLAGFYSSSSGSAISVDSLEVRGLGAPNDSVLLQPKRATSSVYLPFRANYESVQWVFSFETAALNFPELYDTLSFEYTTIPYFASADCGAMYIYRVNHIEVTKHLIDSVVVTDSLFTNVDIQQIKIYFRTSEE